MEWPSIILGSHLQFLGVKNMQKNGTRKWENKFTLRL